MKTARRWVRWIARHNKEQMNYCLMFPRTCWSEKDMHVKTSTANRDLGRDFSMSLKGKELLIRSKLTHSCLGLIRVSLNLVLLSLAEETKALDTRKCQWITSIVTFSFFPLKIWLKPQVYICSFTPEAPSHLPSHFTSRLSQNSGLSSLFYTANSHELSILHMVTRFHARLSSHPILSFPHCVYTAALQTGSSFSIVNVSGLFMYPINMDLHEFNPLDRAIFKKVGFPS